MKTLTNHTIIYDNECPLCNAYTGAFVKTGMLDESGRAAYSEKHHTDTAVNWERARNEIALINLADNSVLYGVDSLLRIIGYNMPWVQKIFRIRPLRYLLDRLYFFISFNRKVIAPGKQFEGQNLCIPDMNYTYRWTYIVFAAGVTSFILNYYLPMVKYFPPVKYTNLVLGFCGLTLVQGIVVGLTNRRKVIHYLGNMMTVGLAGSILLSPLMVFKSLIDSNELFTGYLILIMCLALFEHIRRAKLLELPNITSVTWMFYIFAWIL
ncbi:MAG TPA: DCC1-like thiol-disulfide oxidoreductase family protein [Cyclobacteriaceae bacterium]|nr:DCC1-like thiol-disulfide oxidoreductase family protein [Cyclobacteriaceae bacterium]